MADVLHLCDNDKVTACSLPFPSYICAQKQMTEKEGGEKREKIISLILAPYYFCSFPGAAPKAGQFYR